MAHEQQTQNRHGKGRGQADDVDLRDRLVAPQYAQGNDQIALPHRVISRILVECSGLLVTRSMRLFFHMPTRSAALLLF